IGCIGDQLVIDEAANVIAVNFQAQVVPLAGIDREARAWAVLRALVLDADFALGFGVAPTADVPPVIVVSVGRVPEDQESFGAAGLASFELQRVVGPLGLAGDCPGFAIGGR